MPYVARKPFTFLGVHYRPGDVLEDLPANYRRADSLLRSGYVIYGDDQPSEPVKKAPAKRGRKAKAEPAEVVEEVVETVEADDDVEGVVETVEADELAEDAIPELVAADEE